MTIDNNIHINMKFSQKPNGKLVPSKIVLKPKISSQFMKKSRTGSKEVSGAKKKRKRSSSRNSKGSRASRRSRKKSGSVRGGLDTGNAFG
jgi:hypothetical protein